MKNSVQNSKESTHSVQEVELSQIVTNSYNHRKSFDEQSMCELSANIQQYGVLQPVLLRKVGKKFEIVYGERRFRAAQMAGLLTIPANIRKLTDEEALEISVVENLQRENIKPMEEAAGFIALLETKKYDYAALAKKVGKSECYVRNRVKLKELIYEIGQILDQEEINIGVALCIATYPADIQNDVYFNHLACRGYSWWGHLSTLEFKRCMENTYSLLLENFQFDKTPCVNCPHNTNTYNIFPEGMGKCTERSCLIERNSDHLVMETIKLANTDHIQYVRVDHTNIVSDSIFKAFEKEGLIIPIGFSSAYAPEIPEQPKREEFVSEDDYEDALSDFRDEYEEYEAEKAVFDEQLADGRIAKCVYIECNRIKVIYLNVKEQKEEPRYDDTVSDEQEEQEDTERAIPTPSMNHSTQIRTLKKQDERNNEIAIEHILEDAKEVIGKLPEYSGELSDLEIKMMYYFMLPSLSREKERILIPGQDFATSNDRVKLIENLTVEKMSLIVREYIRVNFKQQTYRGSAVADHFLAFVDQHCPEQLDEITQKHQGIYEKRKQRIDEQLAALTPAKPEQGLPDNLTGQTSPEEPEEPGSSEYEAPGDVLPATDVSMLEVA